jgi:sugar O-acyltransferase (sialic acid O-acetyltransferase NeuD family)
MKRAFIFGAGGHARVIASLLDREVTFVDRQDEPAFFENIDQAREAEIYLGIGDNLIRRRIFNELVSNGIAPATCVAPTAFVANTAKIGPGTVICPGAAVMAGAVIGADVIINTNSSVDHDCRIGNHTQITVGVTLPGSVTVGENCFFGVKSATFPRITIGDNVIVRGGALVIKDVPANVVVGGNPAQVLAL